jgi:hypothetical protein
MGGVGARWLVRSRCSLCSKESAPPAHVLSLPSKEEGWAAVTRRGEGSAARKGEVEAGLCAIDSS